MQPILNGPSLSKIWIPKSAVFSDLWSESIKFRFPIFSWWPVVVFSRFTTSLSFQVVRQSSDLPRIYAVWHSSTSSFLPSCPPVCILHSITSRCSSLLLFVVFFAWHYHRFARVTHSKPAWSTEVKQKQLQTHLRPQQSFPHSFARGIHSIHFSVFCSA